MARLPAPSAQPHSPGAESPEPITAPTDPTAQTRAPQSSGHSAPGRMASVGQQRDSGSAGASAYKSPRRAGPAAGGAGRGGTDVSPRRRARACAGVAAGGRPYPIWEPDSCLEEQPTAGSGHKLRPGGACSGGD